MKTTLIRSGEAAIIQNGFKLTFHIELIQIPQPLSHPALTFISFEYVQQSTHSGDLVAGGIRGDKDHARAPYGHGFHGAENEMQIICEKGSRSDYLEQSREWLEISTSILTCLERLR